MQFAATAAFFASILTVAAAAPVVPCHTQTIPIHANSCHGPQRAPCAPCRTPCHTPCHIPCHTQPHCVQPPCVRPHFAHTPCAHTPCVHPNNHVCPQHQNYHPYDTNYDAICDENQNANDNANTAASKSANANDNENIAQGGEGYGRGGDGWGFSEAENANRINVHNANINELEDEIENTNTNTNQEEQSACAVSDLNNANDAEACARGHADSFANIWNDNEAASAAEAEDCNADFNRVCSDVENSFFNHGGRPCGTIC